MSMSVTVHLLQICTNWQFHLRIHSYLNGISGANHYVASSGGSWTAGTAPVTVASCTWGDWFSLSCVCIPKVAYKIKDHHCPAHPQITVFQSWNTSIRNLSFLFHCYVWAYIFFSRGIHLGLSCYFELDEMGGSLPLHSIHERCHGSKSGVVSCVTCFRPYRVGPSPNGTWTCLWWHVQNIKTWPLRHTPLPTSNIYLLWKLQCSIICMKWYTFPNMPPSEEVSTVWFAKIPNQPVQHALLPALLNCFRLPVVWTA